LRPALDRPHQGIESETVTRKEIRCPSSRPPTESSDLKKVGTEKETIMRTSINTRSSIRTSIASALLGSLVMIGGCGDMESELPIETASSQQALQPTAPGAEVWRANMGVTVAATKDSFAKKITYVFEATNHGDDDARSAVLVAHFPPGVTVSTVTSRAFDTCSAPTTVGSGASYVQCARASIGVHATSSLTVTVNNPGNAASQASGQVSNISPDPIVANNYAHVSVP
jgi:hypothetical protein